MIPMWWRKAYAKLTGGTVVILSTFDGPLVRVATRAGYDRLYTVAPCGDALLLKPDGKVYSLEPTGITGWEKA